MFDDFGDLKWTGKVPHIFEPALLASNKTGNSIIIAQNKEKQFNTAEFVMSSYNFSNFSGQADATSLDDCETFKLHEKDISGADMSRVKESGIDIRWSELKKMLEQI